MPAALRTLPPARSIASVALAALVFWAPLPYASVRPEDRFLLVVAAATLLVLTAAEPRLAGLGAVRAIVAAWGAWVAWTLAQTVPVPLAWIELLAPGIGRAHARASALTGSEAGPAPFSVAPDQTLAAAIWLGALLALFVVSALCGQRTRHRRILGCGLLAAIAFQILYGARHWGTGGSIIWGRTVPGGSGRLRGTYVNPDHLALLLEIGVCVAGAFLWWAIRKGRNDRTWEVRIARIALPGLLWVGLFAALAFTGSRAGILAGIVGTISQGVLVGLRRRRTSYALTGVALVLLGSATVAWLGLDAGWGRWLSTSRYEIETNIRLAAYGATLGLWRLAPWTGIGLGGFRAAFPVVQPQDAPGRWHHAHNDWLELLATGGPIALALVLFGVGALGLRLTRVWRHGARSEARAAALGALGALVAVALHELLDFGLTTPANAVALVVVAGGAAGARQRTTSRRTASRYEEANASGE